ncbi:MAG: hypothetical protein ACR2LU_02690 [Luteitalea sp.]|nr:hypothetical protein [Acidobacteriota bacterium]
MSADLARVLTDYRTGLDTTLQLLDHLETLSVQQRALPHPHDPEALTVLAEDRERQLATLFALELQLAPLRQQIADRVVEARALAGFDGVADRHRLAGEQVARIMHADAESLQALTRAERDRRAASQSLETGEATLAAYRRVLQQPHGSSGLFAQRG